MYAIHVSLNDILGKILPLIVDHGRELLGSDFNMDINTLFLIDKSGVLDAFIVAEADQILGYSIFICGREWLSQHVTKAENIAIYISPEHRGGPALDLLMTESEKYFEKQSITKIQFMSNGTKSLKHLFERHGYTSQSEVMEKVL